MIFNNLNLDYHYTKMHWKERYVTQGLNQKFFGVIPVGVYAGLTIGPGPLGPRDIIVGPGSVSGNFGTGVSGYDDGGFDATIGYSIAVQDDPLNGVSKLVQIPPGPTSIMHLDATSVSGGGRVFVVLDAPYVITPANDQQPQPHVMLVSGSEIDLRPDYVVIGHVDVPAVSGTPLDPTMFGYDDPVYPRLTPFATQFKPGFMTPQQVVQLQQIMPWQNLMVLNVDPNDFFNVTITPSQLTVLGTRIYAYVLPSISSKFPRNASGLYNGGPLDNALTTLNIPTGVIGGAHQIPGNTTFAIPSVSGTANAFQVGLISLDAGDSLTVQYGNIFTSVSAATLDDNLPISGSSLMPIGCFVVSTDASGNIQPLINPSVPHPILWRRPFLNLGGGGSGGSGTLLPAPGFQTALLDQFSALPTSIQSIVDITHTNASYVAAAPLFQLSCDKNPLITTVGTSFTLSQAPGYTMKPGDIIWSNAQQIFRRILTVTNQTSGTLAEAFPVNLTSDAGMVSQAIWTKDIVNYGDPAGVNLPLPFASLFGATDLHQFAVSYEDSVLAGDKYGQLASNPYIVVAGSNNGLVTDVGLPAEDTFCPIFSRPIGAATYNNVSFNLNTNKQRCFLVFFPNPNNVSVVNTANLINYKVSLYEISQMQNGGFLNSGFAINDDTNLFGIASVSGGIFDSSVSGNVCEVTLGFDYVPGINPNSPNGDLELEVEGLEVPRLCSGMDITKTSVYFEVAGSTRKIRIFPDISYAALAQFQSIQIKRRQGSIDTSDQNALRLAALNDVIVGTAAQVTAGQADFSSLQAAVNSLSGPGQIQILVATLTENIVLTNNEVKIVGKGHGTVLNGNFSVSGNFNVIKDMKFTGAVVIGGVGNQFVDDWIGVSGTFTDSGSGTRFGYVQETS